MPVGLYELVPVVRCRFCKWRPRNMGTGVDVEQLSFPLDSQSIEVCPCAAGDPWYNIEPNPNGYCWKGEWDDKEVERCLSAISAS